MNIKSKKKKKKKRRKSLKSVKPLKLKIKEPYYNPFFPTHQMGLIDDYEISPSIKSKQTLDG
jgi:hypothetical protein